MTILQMTNNEEKNFEKSDILKEFEILIQKNIIYKNYIIELIKEPEFVKTMGNDCVFLIQHELYYKNQEGFLFLI
jgi:hypothetical protein